MDSLPEEEATIAEMVEALLVFDESILNSRYHGMLARHPENHMRRELVQLPGKILKAGRAARSGAEKWMRTDASIVGDGFLEWGERSLLDSFLSLVESQMRLLAYMARTSPTSEIRAHFDETVQLHREAAKTLRDAVTLLVHNHPPPVPRDVVRGAQEEEGSGDLRGQVEAALRASAESGFAVRHVTLSHTGLRHLRDQGLFQNGETTIAGTPVIVDFAWDTPGFALQSFDAVPLEEVLTGAPVERLEI